MAIGDAVAAKPRRGGVDVLDGARRGESPVAIELVKRRVQTRLERKRTGPAEWLVVTRRPLTDDRALEPRASRDATEQDER